MSMSKLFQTKTTTRREMTDTQVLELQTKAVKFWGGETAQVIEAVQKFSNDSTVTLEAAYDIALIPVSMR